VSFPVDKEDFEASDLRTIPSYPESFKKVLAVYERLARRIIGLDQFDRISCLSASIICGLCAELALIK
jgi:hypothetical protein